MNGRLDAAIVGVIIGALISALGSVLSGSVIGVVFTIVGCGVLASWLTWRQSPRISHAKSVPSTSFVPRQEQQGRVVWTCMCGSR